jgi:preprotein translocase subunit SecY
MHTPDRGLYERLGVTLLVLLAYRVGCHLPLPGLEAQKIGLLYESGGTATARVSVLALGIMPLLSALILLEIVKLAAPELRTWERATPRNQRRYGYVAVGLALVLALMQSAGISSALEQVTALVPEPGTAFRAVAIATLMAGTALVIAFATIIDRAGLGNGIWIMFLAPVLAELPRTIAGIVAMHVGGQYPFELIAASFAFLVLAVAAVVALLLAARNREVVASTCAWTPLISYSLLPWLLLPIGLIGTKSADGAIALMLTGPLHHIVLTVLVVLVAALSVRSFARIGEASPVPAIIIGLTLAAIVVAADLMQVLLSAVAPLVSTNIIVATVVGVALLGRWGTLPSGAQAEDDPPLSPRA